MASIINGWDNKSSTLLCPIYPSKRNLNNIKTMGRGEYIEKMSPFHKNRKYIAISQSPAHKRIMRMTEHQPQPQDLLQHMLSSNIIYRSNHISIETLHELPFREIEITEYVIPDHEKRLVDFYHSLCDKELSGDISETEREYIPFILSFLERDSEINKNIERYFLEQKEKYDSFLKKANELTEKLNNLIQHKK